MNVILFIKISVEVVIFYSRIKIWKICYNIFAFW